MIDHLVSQLPPGWLWCVSTHTTECRASVTSPDGQNVTVGYGSTALEALTDAVQLQDALRG